MGKAAVMTKKVLGNREESRRGRERAVALLKGTGRQCPPHQPKGPEALTGSLQRLGWRPSLS